MKLAPLGDARSPPTVVEAGGASLDALCNWLAREPGVVDAAIHASGALLLRGFPVDAVADFSRVCLGFSPELRAYVGGDSPRVGVADKVYTSTELPREQEIHLHNELTYSGWWPRRVFFHCRVPARAGGQTHIADSRAVYREIDAGVRERFAARGITYLRGYHDHGGAGKSWRETFETDDRDVVERFCREAGMTCEWTDWGLRTLTDGPAVIDHPVTGETAWINQADQFHAGFLTPWKDTFDRDAFAADALPFHARFGDGTEIDVADLHEVRRAGRACEVQFDWRAGDVLVLDNILTMHGRKPFEGEREVLVAMA